MADRDRVLNFDDGFKSLDADLQETQKTADHANKALGETEAELEQLKQELLAMPGVKLPVDCSDDLSLTVEELNHTMADIVLPRFRKTLPLTPVDVTAAILSGVVASVVDIVFVGSPEVVKIYRGGENFDGSILTKALRKLGQEDGRLKDMLKYLSDNCKVPYDISARKDVVTPDNHRLRGFAHDPLFGLMFAVADILMGTTTTIDNEGHLRVLFRDKSYPDSQKLLAVVYYLGHLLSDVCTARGLPIPGFCMTQFFTKGEDSSLAKMCESMYKDGYDLRHLASMSVPVAIKNMLLDLYIRLFRTEELTGVHNIAEREIDETSKRAFRYELRLISDAVACGGNVLKFFLPPTAGNPTALNLPEWISLLKDTIANGKYLCRDTAAEEAVFTRQILNDNWLRLQ